LEPLVPSVAADALAWRETGRRAVDALLPIPGPVHLNLPFEEPLVPTKTIRTKTSGGPKPPSRDLEAQPLPRVVARFAGELSGARGVLVAGGWPRALPRVARFLVAMTHWPVLSEPPAGAGH